MKTGREHGSVCGEGRFVQFFFVVPNPRATTRPARISPLMRSQNQTELRTTRLLTGIVVLTNVVGNVSLSHGMRQVGRIVSASPLDYLRAFTNPWTVGGVLVLIIWMIADLALLSRADLSFVLPVTASAYVLIAVAGHFLLSERISWHHWLAIFLITFGVILAEETPPRTTKGPPEHLL